MHMLQLIVNWEHLINDIHMKPTLHCFQTEWHFSQEQAVGFGREGGRSPPLSANSTYSIQMHIFIPTLQAISWFQVNINLKNKLKTIKTYFWFAGLEKIFTLEFERLTKKFIKTVLETSHLLFFFSSKTQWRMEIAVNVVWFWEKKSLLVQAQILPFKRKKSALFLHCISFVTITAEQVQNTTKSH